MASTMREYNILMNVTVQGSPVVGSAGHAGLSIKDAVGCFSFDYSVSSGRSVGAGSTRREHAEVVITKAFDETSPLLWKAITKNEKVDGVQFHFVRANADTGDDEEFFTVELENGHVTSVAQNAEDAPGTGPFDPMERIKFSFEKISLKYASGGLSAMHKDEGTRNG